MQQAATPLLEALGLVFDTVVRGHAAGRLEQATDGARFRATQWLASLQAEGGTELTRAMSAALSCFGSADGVFRERAVVLITDGQVGDEQRLLNLVGRSVGRGRSPTRSAAWTP
ncbi:MAG: hypothetical protein HY319_30640, partial [Armatimonadetes bacterium]|nr:hypothetical protein [Armatimonadota bacterium]